MHSVGMYATDADGGELAAVRVVRVRRGAAFSSARRGAGSPNGVRAEVQVLAECAR